MPFLPTPVQRHPKPATARSPESLYWRKYKHPVFIKNYSPVTSIHFSPSEPHRYAVTAAIRVQIFAPRTQKLLKAITRFNDVARGGNIRHDGKLIVAGDDSGTIQMFDISTRAVLRTLKEHKQPVHVTRFSVPGSTQLLSCSDDTTVKIWDIPTQASICTFTEHTDYVRSGVISNNNPNVILTGSYDSTLRLYDSRTGASELVMGSAEQGQAPVEDVLLFPSGTLAASSSGPILKIWDIVAGGRCIRAVSNHQKTITCLAFDSKASRILTGGLDQMVKVYDVANYKVVHTMRYSAPLLCLAVSPDDTHLAAGMSDGTLSVRRRNTSEEETQAMAARKKAAQLGNIESLVEEIGEPRYLQNGVPQLPRLTQAHEEVAPGTKKTKLSSYDKLMRKFRYGEVLDAILIPGISPTTFFSVVQELMYREALRPALSGRDDILLEPVLKVLSRHITDAEWGIIACEVAGVVLDMYASVVGLSPIIDSELADLQRRVKVELGLQSKVSHLRGALNMIMSTSVLASA